MKRLVLTLAIVACISARADEWTDPATGYTWSYRVNGETVEIYKESKTNRGFGDTAVSPLPTGDLTIPSSLGGKTVTGIGEFAFSECNELSSVKIPDSVMVIGGGAFLGCQNLTNVTIPSSVTNIEAAAFENCWKLASITIPSSVRNLERCAFYGCHGLKSVTIPNSVTNIGEMAFENCGLQEIRIPASVRCIGDDAFARCHSMQRVVLKGDAPVIGKRSFGTWIGKDGKIYMTTSGTFQLPEGNSTYKVVDGMWQGWKVEWWNPLASIFETRKEMLGPLTVELGADEFDCASASLAAIDMSALDQQGLKDALGKLARASDSLAKSASGEEAATRLDELWKSVSQYQKVAKISNEEALNSYLCLLYTKVYGEMSNEDAKAKVKAEILSLRSRAAHGEEYFQLYSREVKLAGLPKRPNSLVGLFSSCPIPASWKKKEANATKKEMESFKQAFIKSTAIPMLKADRSVIDAASKLVKTDSKVEAEKQLARIDASVKELTRLSGQDVGRYAYSQQQKAMNASMIAEEHVKFLEEMEKMVDSPEAAAVVKEKAAVCVKAAAVARAKAQKLGAPAQSSSRIGTGLYMVIDLSGGKDAKSYPVKYLNAEPKDGWTDEYKTTKLVLRRIKPGSFMMGSPANELGRAKDDVVRNEIQHKVTITKPFYIGVFEVTQKQYELVTDKKPSHDKGDMRPVSSVKRNDVRGDSFTYNWPSVTDVDPASFMGKIRMKTGISTFDLPTEAMWEFACRAGTTTALNNGKNLADERQDGNAAEIARYEHNNSGYKVNAYSDSKGGYNDRHTTVGLYRPNAWRLYDMHGNVAEFCLDWMNPMTKEAAKDPVGPMQGTCRGRDGDYLRVYRGGDWSSLACDVRSAYRGGIAPDISGPHWGFRLCCFTELPVKAKAPDNVPVARTETIDGYTWSYRLYGETVEIVSPGSSDVDKATPAVSPAPKGDLVIPATLGGKQVTGVGKNAFSGCSDLTSVTIPQGVNSIWGYAFFNCRSLTNVTIPNSVTNIGEWAFGQCGLMSIEIPDSVKVLGPYAFRFCGGLKNVIIGSDVAPFAFEWCRNLTSVTMSDSVKYIGQNAFDNCISLESVTIPASVRDIGWEAFRGCSNLKSVYFRGDAPGGFIGQTFKDVPADCKAYVFADATGFKVDASGKWNGLMVVRQKEKKP